MTQSEILYRALDKARYSSYTYPTMDALTALISLVVLFAMMMRMMALLPRDWAAQHLRVH